MLAKLGLAFGKAADLDKVKYIAGGGPEPRRYINQGGDSREHHFNYEVYSLRKAPESGWDLVCSERSSQRDESFDSVIGHFPKLEHGVMILDSMAKAYKFMPSGDYSAGFETHASLRQVKRALELKNE